MAEAAAERARGPGEAAAEGLRVEAGGVGQEVRELLLLALAALWFGMGVVSLAVCALVATCGVAVANVW